jgi:enoyl-CoA hydratase/carnithine racemase
MAQQRLTMDIDGAIATMTLHGDGGIGDETLRELNDACQAINDMENIRVALLASDGEVFASGWDESAEPQSSVFTCLESMRQPAICAVNGDAISAGLELALACDVRIASDNARFALPETTQGGMPLGGGTQRLARLVGRAEALRMILLGEEIDAEEALRIGLVSQVVAAERLLDEARSLAATMAARGPIALRYAKEALRRGLDLSLDQALRYETDLTIILQATEDRAEGVAAFLEKREPKFKGR